MLDDLVAALRQIRRHPGFHALATLILSLGIGLNIAAFSLIDVLLLRPPAAFEPDRMVTLEVRTAGGELSIPAVSRFIDWRRQSVRSFESFEAAMAQPFPLTRVARPRIVRGAHLTAGFFRLHRVDPALGRLFDPGDDEPGRPDIVVLSHSFWHEEFGSDRSVIGRTIMLNQRAHRITGVAPEGFAPMPGEFGVFVPFVLQRFPHSGAAAFARLAPGVSIGQARAEMALITQRLKPESEQRAPEIILAPFGEPERRAVRSALLAAFAATAIVLLVTCANIGGVLLARGFARRHEYAIRVALGATRARLIAQMMIESAVLALLAAAGGLFGARIFLKTFSQVQVAGLEGIQEARIDSRAFLFSVALCLVTPLLASLGPALSSFAAFAPSRRNEAARRVLVALQIAAAFLLVCSSGLLVQSFRHLQSQTLGYEPHQLLGMHIRLPDDRAADAAAVAAMHRMWKARVAAVPGVESVALALRTPMSGSGLNYGLELEHRRPHQETPMAEANLVDEDYFRTLRIPILAGRNFHREDRLGGKLVVIVNQAVARRLYPNRNPIGQVMELASFNPTLTKTDTTAKREIIGVVGDSKQEALRLQAPLLLYLPAAQNPYREVAFLVRAKGDPERLVDEVRRVLALEEPDLPAFSVTVLETKIDRILATDRHATMLLSALAAIALVLSMLGAYGVLSYAMARRTREFGIRMALGAPAKSIVGLVLAEAVALCLAGLGVGFVCYLPLRRILETFLFGIATLDPATLIFGSAVILVSGLVAAIRPALGAGRVDPGTALRVE